MLDEFQARLWSERPAAFFRERGLTHSTVSRFALGYTGELGEGSPDLRHCLVMPYEDGLGRVRQLRYRPLYDSSLKYISMTGDEPHLFAVRATEQATAYVCEGEIDAMSAWQAGIKAVGVPGAHAWRPEWRWLFRNCRRVVLALDPDEAGLGAAKALLQSLRTVSDVEIAHLPDGQDVNDVLRKRGERGVREILGVA